MKLSGKLYTCNTCNKKKQISEYYLRNSGRQKGQRVSPACKHCTLNSKKEIRDSDLEGARVQEKNRRVNNPEVYRRASSKYRSNNLEICRERSNKSSKEYYKRYPEKQNAKGARYRARKENACPDWLDQTQLSAIKSVYKIARNLSKKTGIEHHVDHVVPLKSELVCGLHVPWNLQVIPKIDNLIKSNRLIEEIVLS